MAQLENRGISAVAAAGASLLDPVAGLVRATAAREILPRFQALGAGDIGEKRPGDFVTVADLETERHLVRDLQSLAPGSVAFGEEGVAADPALLDLIGGERPVWIIDPIDGTGNFARGRPGFAVLVAYLQGGVTEAGWIYDPLADAMACAARGCGAWSEGRRLHVAAETAPEQMEGSAYGRTKSGQRNGNALAESGRIAGIRNHGCSGLEYLELALGRSHFTLHSRSLPWDHAAGMLIVAEAGGVASFLDGSPYDPRKSDGAPLAAASATAWRLVRDIVTDPAR